MPDLRKVILWMAGALIAFTTMAISVRELTGSLSIFEILALRNISGIAILLVYTLAFARAGIGAPHPLWLHVLRNVFHFGGQSCWVYGLTKLSLATVFALEFTTPAWTMVLAVLFLGERITAGRLASVLLGFVGVLVILRPGAGTFRPEGLVVLLAAVQFAVQLTTTKALTARTSVLTILFWMNVMQLPLYLAAQALAFGPSLILPRLDLAMLPALIGLCFSGLLAHVCITNAFRHGEAIMVVPIDFLRIPLIATVGVMLYREAFDPIVLLGATISAVGILWSLLEKTHTIRSREQTPA